MSSSAGVSRSMKFRRTSSTCRPRCMLPTPSVLVARCDAPPMRAAELHDCTVLGFATKTRKTRPPFSCEFRRAPRNQLTIASCVVARHYSLVSPLWLINHLPPFDVIHRCCAQCCCSSERNSSARRRNCAILGPVQLTGLATVFLSIFRRWGTRAAPCGHARRLQTLARRFRMPNTYRTARVEQGAVTSSSWARDGWIVFLFGFVHHPGSVHSFPVWRSARTPGGLQRRMQRSPRNDTACKIPARLNDRTARLD